MERAEVIRKNGRLYCEKKDVWCAFINLDDGTCRREDSCRVGTEEYIKEQLEKEKDIQNRMRLKEAKGENL